MNLEQQVCNLELSKRLKELGVTQDAWWSWYDTTDRDDTPALNRRSDKGCPSCGFPKSQFDEEISAFTVAELGILIEPCEKMLLPQFHSTKHFWFSPGYETTEAATEADARALMMIYLLENNLLSTT